MDVQIFYRKMNVYYPPHNIIPYLRHDSNLNNKYLLSYGLVVSFNVSTFKILCIALLLIVQNGCPTLGFL
jgi:hypothetical protein